MFFRSFGFDAEKAKYIFNKNRWDKNGGDMLLDARAYGLPDDFKWRDFLSIALLLQFRVG